MWIRCDNALHSIVSPDMFARAQELRAVRKPRHLVSDQQALDRLSALLRRAGTLSLKIIREAKDVPSPITFIKRFGSVVAAYDLIGFRLARFRRAEFAKKISSIIEARTHELVLQIENLGAKVTLDEGGQIVINDGVIVSICVARAYAYMPGRRRWRLGWARQRAWSAPSDLTLVITMDDIDREIAQYYLSPSDTVKLARISEKKLHQVFAVEFLHGNLKSVAEAICTASPA